MLTKYNKICNLNNELFPHPRSSISTTLCQVSRLEENTETLNKLMKTV
jgi:hypothetical protein